MLQQKPGEPDRWFDLFSRFTLMGPRRSLLGCYNALREEEGQDPVDRVPGAWVDAAREWEWRERAAAWDRQQRAEDAEEFEELRRQLKQQRIDALKTHLDKLGQALEKLDPDSASWRDTAHGLRVCTDGLRKEMDDLPTEKHLHQLDVIISTLPAPLQEALARALEA